MYANNLSDKNVKTLKTFLNGIKTFLLFSMQKRQIM